MSQESHFLLKPRYGYLHLVVVVAIIGGVFFWQKKVFSDRILAAAYQSPLPQVVVYEGPMVLDPKAYRQAYQFSDDWFTPHIPVWKKVLGPFQDKPNVRYLEVGVYEGRSAFWMLENILTQPTAHATLIDPFFGPYKETFQANLERSGAKDRVQVVTGYSQIELRSLPLNSFDIIYIDGSHAKDDVLEDAVLSFRLLKDGGILIFDDYRWIGRDMTTAKEGPDDMPKPAIDAFVQCFERKLEVIHNAYQLILRKKSAPPQ